MKKSNYVVWPVPSSKFLKMARGPKSLATPGLDQYTIFKCIHDDFYLKKNYL